MLTKEQILNAADLKTEKVEVPEWGGFVLVRTMTGADRDAFEQSIVDAKAGRGKANLANIRAKFCATVIVDEDNNRLFSEADIVALGKKSAAALDRIFEIGQTLNAFSDKDVEELAKN